MRDIRRRGRLALVQRESLFLLLFVQRGDFRTRRCPTKIRPYGKWIYFLFFLLFFLFVCLDWSTADSLLLIRNVDIHVRKTQPQLLPCFSNSSQNTFAERWRERCWLRRGIGEVKEGNVLGGC